MRCAIHALKSPACLKISRLENVRWLNIPSAGQICELGRLHDPGRRHGSPPRRVLPGGLLRGAAALADPERADGAGCAAHGGARHEAPGLLPEGLAVRGGPAEAVRVQVGRCHDEPTLDRAVSSHWLPASVALRISHGRTAAAFVPAGGPPSPPPPLLSSSPVPLSARQFSPVAGRRTSTASLPHLHTHNTYPRTKEPASVARAVLPLSCPSSPRVERSDAGRVVRAGRTRTSTRRSSTTARASSSAPPPPRRRAWTPPPPTVHHAPSPDTLEHEPYPEP